MMESKKIFNLVIAVVFCFFTIPMIGQIENTWLGGSPGHETDWSYYKNWSAGYVPDWTSHVIIPQQYSLEKNYPQINEGFYEVYSLTIQGNAYLSICDDCEIKVENEFDYVVYQKIKTGQFARNYTLICQNESSAYKNGIQ